MERKTYFSTKSSQLNPEVTILKIDGFVDVNVVPEFEKNLESLLEKNHIKLVLDFSSVTYISSAGIGAIVGSLQTFRDRRSGDIKLMHVLPKIMTVLRSIALHELIDIISSEEDITYWLPRQTEADFDHFRLKLLDVQIESGQEFGIIIRACNGQGETIEDYHGVPKISSDDGLVLPRELSNFQKGVWEGNILTTGTDQVRLKIEDSGRSTSFDIHVAAKEARASFPQLVGCQLCGTKAKVKGIGIYRCQKCNEIVYIDPWVHVITLYAGNLVSPKLLTHKGAEIKFNSDVNYLTSVRRFIVGLCEQENLSETLINEVVLATEEVLLNIIEHGHDFNPYHVIDLRLKILPQRLEIRVRDRGKTFDVTKHKHLSLKSIISHGKKGGLGAVLVNQLMDNIRYQRFSRYNQLVMSKRLQRRVDYDQTSKNTTTTLK